MISDESDEDADGIDDDDLVETYLAPNSSNRGLTSPEAGEENVAPMQDWPPSGGRDCEPEIDAQTLAWFRANHAEWRPAMESVLRAWVNARMQTATSRRQTDTTDDGGTA
jgi:hypothetical protein